MNTLALRKETTYAQDVLIVLLSGLLITLMGQFSIPLPFTPIPISFRLQTILFLSVLLGSRRAILATGLFLAQGICLGNLVPFTEGYLFGYLVAALVVGYMSEKYNNKNSLCFLVGTLIVYACGSAYLATFMGLQKALLLGVLPFIVGDLLKSIVCLKILQWIRRV